MDTQIVGKTLLDHDHYDVFLAVAFGFCYCSALVPLVQMLQTENREERLLSGVLVLARGSLTVVGLACLYGWYAIYLRALCQGSPPAMRMLLDWVSLGLFAVGANCWNNHKHNPYLYCLVEAVAVTTFGITCGIELYNYGMLDERSKPLLRAAYTCLVLVSCFGFGVAVAWRAKKVFAGNDAPRKKSVTIFWQAILIVGLLFVVDALLFSIPFKSIIKGSASQSWTQGVLEFWSRLPSMIGITEFIVGTVLMMLVHLAFGIGAVVIEDPGRRKDTYLILATCIPMLALIFVTVISSSTMFPRLF